MLKDIELLIEKIQDLYIKFSNMWEESEYFKKINLKNNQVIDIQNNELLLNNVLNYREYVNERSLILSIFLNKFNSSNMKMNYRVKTRNSVEFKLQNYITNHNNGKEPINKCFNDLYRNKNNN